MRQPGVVAHGQDSVSLAGRILYGLVQSLNNRGREAGSLPADLAALGRESPGGARDPWGREIGYVRAGLHFELRSAGPDGMPGTRDDVIATGQVGRNYPCEVRSESRVVQWDEFAPPCSPDAPVQVLPLCYGLLDAADPEAPASSRDTSDLVGYRLVGIARRIDGKSREVGGLLPTLRPVRGAEPLGTHWGFWDAWGSEIRYTRQGEAFELRSPGPDRSLETADDISVTGRLGYVAACEYYIGSTRRTCDVPPPSC